MVPVTLSASDDIHLANVGEQPEHVVYVCVLQIQVDAATSEGALGLTQQIRGKSSGLCRGRGGLDRATELA